MMARAGAQVRGPGVPRKPDRTDILKLLNCHTGTYHTWRNDADSFGSIGDIHIAKSDETT